MFTAVALAEVHPKGSELYTSICASCHGESGQGVPGAYPPLAGHIADLLASAGGREHMARVLLYGIEGPIDVLNVTYNGSMPAWNSRSDEDLADLFNHLATEWGDLNRLADGFQLADSAFMSDVRSNALAPDEVRALRPELADSISTEEVVTEIAPGFYAAHQVSSGSSLYRSNCSACHGTDLNGDVNSPPLTGDFFMDYWSGKAVAELYGYARNNMPPSNPDSLPEQQYLDIIAFVLSENGHEAGEVPLSEDNISRLQQLRIGVD